MMIMCDSVAKDVKLRTNELNSQFHAWKEGMKEWRKIYEIDELKHLILGRQSFTILISHEIILKTVLSQKITIELLFIESKSEILDEVVQAYVKNLSDKNEKQRKKSQVQESSSDEGGQEEEVKKQSNGDENGNEKENDDLYYYSKPDKKYKVFDPRTKTWSAQDSKPSTEQIANLRKI